MSDNSLILPMSYPRPLTPNDAVSLISTDFLMDNYKWTKKSIHQVGSQVDVLRLISPKLVAVGCYQFERDAKCRTGALHLLNFETGKLIENFCELGQYDLQVVDSDHLLSVNSNFQLSFWICSSDNIQILSQSKQTDVREVGTSVAVKNGQAAASAADGHIGVFDFAEGQITPTGIWKGHASECWSLMFLDDSILLSGSEDPELKMWDLRSGSCVMRNNKHHAAGVVHLSRMDENYILSGSYDEKLRVWDARNMSGGPILEYETEGGVWDVSWNEDRSKGFLLSNCFGGVQRWENEGGTFRLKKKEEIIGPSKDETEVYYASAWVSDTEVCVSSFYARTVELYEFVGV